MNIYHIRSRVQSTPRTVRRILIATVAGLTTVTASVVFSQVTLPPTIALASEPLYMNGAKSKANLTLALSVEFPTVGQTYRDTFDKAKEYVGYFDPKSCYRHVPASGGKGAYFDWSGAPNASGSCGGGGFNGNFMNWATSSAIDIMRYGLTGGNRTTDESSGAGTTIVERAWLPDSFYNDSAYFTEKILPKALVPEMIESSVANKVGKNDMYIYNCRDRVYFAKARDITGGCTNPFGVANALSSNLVGPNSTNTYYEVRNLVCDPNSAGNRLMTYDAGSKQWKGLCWRYPNGKFKPVGQFQMNAENLRVSVFGYLQDNNRSRYGGMLRAPLKYLGPKSYDMQFNLQAGTNPRAEWNATTGVFVDNPHSGDASYGAQGYPKSGAIMYVNKFGTLNPDAVGVYKNLDPVSELYYEALRYLQGKQPTPQASSGITGVAASDKALKENFPAYTSWTDPFTGFVDTTGEGRSCLRNSIVTISDVFTHSDRSVPGNTNTTNQDFARGAETSPALDVPFWTGLVGSFESRDSVAGTPYKDSLLRDQNAGNLPANTKYSALANAATMDVTNDTGADGGSHYIAGLAYWANTQSFRASNPKARVTTYTIDVNENDASSDVNFRRQTQLYLAAKYGGFDDWATGRTGSPYSTGNNAAWQGSDGDAKNYFLVSDAKKFLDSLSEIFARVVEETGSIAGGALSTQRLAVADSASVYQARFNPVANYWSGRLLKYPLTLSPTTGVLELSTTPSWEAGRLLTDATLLDNGSGRNIVIGSPVGQPAVSPTAFQWANLAQPHKDALNMSASGIADTLGTDRLAWLRGDQRKEFKPTNAAGPFRPRDIVLGDIVNSGLVYMGKPSTTIGGSAYKTFYDANKDRKPVVFANANDGMLHAFYDDTGLEAFAYIPGFLAKKLSKLPDVDYSHISMADASPAVSEAQIGSQWRSILVSGVGGGAQGVFALDVTDPAAFTAGNALWEFTDRDHPAMGNVIGAPQIVKLRTTNAGAATPAYKWYVVVASGVNNYAVDGYADAVGNPSLFFLDLAAKPGAGAWTEGTNFWRIELPQTSTAIAKGLAGFSVTKDSLTGTTNALYAGDLQGNVWKFDFSLNGSSQLGTNATTNQQTFNAMGPDKPMFVAKDSSGSLQPITGEPVISNGFLGDKLVSFGTGKFLEAADTTVPLNETASFYTLLDSGKVIAARSKLQAGAIAADGKASVAPFNWGMPPATGTSSLRMGWYIDFDKSIAERQISDITNVAGQLFFGSIYPTKGSCGDGGGRLFELNALNGSGSAQESTVGVLAAPLVVQLGDPSVMGTGSSGQRSATQRLGVIVQGSRGLAVLNRTPTVSYQSGRMSWRQINNYQESKYQSP